LEDIREALEAYFHLGFNDKQLEEHLKDHYYMAWGMCPIFCDGSLAQPFCAV
jgi:hypothetical protein